MPEYEQYPYENPSAQRPAPITRQEPEYVEPCEVIAGALEDIRDELTGIRKLMLELVRGQS